MSTFVKPLVATALTGAAITTMRYLSKCSTLMQSNKHQKTINDDYISSDKIIFIPKQHTEKAMIDNYILETFESTKQLFYYLRWKSNMEAIHQNLKVFTRPKTTKILIFNTNLHCKYNNELIYIIGIENEKSLTAAAKNRRIEKWKMDDYFMTAFEIKTKYNINVHCLPQPIDTKLNIDLNKLKLRKNEISIKTYADLPLIKTNKVKTDKTCKKYANSSSISKQQLMREIKKSDIFRPIISFNDNKTKYYIDIVLLVKIDNNWIGIIFNEHSNYFNPIGIAIDCIDLKNKMYLFKPATNVNQYQWIKSEINCLYIYNDKYVNTINPKDEIIAKLMKENEILRKEKEILKDMNNFYFQQTLNPNSNIRPHAIHQSDAAKQHIIYVQYQ